MTLLTVINDAQDLLTIPRSSAVYGQTGADQRQLLVLLKMEGRQLVMDHDWSQLQETEELTCAATEAQTGYPATGFARMQDGTDMWNSDTQRRIDGPISSREWSDLQVRTSTGVQQYWRIIDGVLNIYAPESGQTITYEWITSKWILQAGVTAATTFSADTDTFRFDEWLLTLGLVWRWKQAKGLDYAEEMINYGIHKNRIILGDKGGISRISTDPMPTFKIGKTWPGSVTGY